MGDAHSGCSGGLVTMQLWHGTLRMVRPASHTSAVSFPFVRTHLITLSHVPKLRARK